jgi:Ca2+-transporting ATPase
MYVAISGMGLIMFVGLLPVFYVYWQHEGVAKAQTMVLVSMILFELLRAFSCRSMHFTIVQLGLFSNPWLVAATASSALLMVAVIYIPSWATAFHTVPIGPGDWGVALGVGGGGFALVEAGKWLAARRRPPGARPAARRPRA